jgi:hypothetical protein
VPVVDVRLESILPMTNQMIERTAASADQRADPGSFAAAGDPADAGANCGRRRDGENQIAGRMAMPPLGNITRSRDTVSRRHVTNLPGVNGSNPRYAGPAITLSIQIACLITLIKICAGGLRS